ncbi:MAG: 4-phosphoerythronate dehydrogenase PdxB [Bacteroidales bacterium]|jgi:erythronate-4-phosphate dehydrogenase|nr:4-phosphoerythronate dehydrogenase PdxB [Bacteroidales bacterium]
MKIVCDHKIPFLKGALEPYAEVVYLPGDRTTPLEVKEADALITRTRTKCNAALLEHSAVKMIATATIGYDHIDTEWCEQRGIAWTNAPGCNSGSVQQYIASVLASLAQEPGFRFENKTLGVVGVGNVGKKVAHLAEILGFRVLLNDPPRARAEGPEAFVSLEQITSECDIISLHVPLETKGPDATYHLFDAKGLSDLSPHQILINSSRGEVVDNQALKTCLKQGGIKAAVLDVWEKEPAIDLELLDLVLYGTPHIAGYSADGKGNGTTMSVRAIAEKFNLPLKNWQASNLPLPAQSIRPELDCRGKSLQEILCRAILHTYRVEDESRTLKQNPGTFEQQRADYAVRREFGCYTLSLQGAAKPVVEKLSALGFKLEILPE